MENDINHLYLELSISIKKMEQNVATIFEDISHERCLILLLSFVEPDILKQSKFTDDKIEIF